MKFFSTFIALLIYAGPLCADIHFADYVDTRIGTDLSPSAKQGAHSEKVGNVQPSAQVPFGMVQWGPDTDHPDSGSYMYADSHIAGFSLTHLSGTGCNNAGEISFLPILDQGAAEVVSSFMHSNEKAEAGYYAVKLENGTGVELTATSRTGFGRFTFPDGKTPMMRINVAKTNTGKFTGAFEAIDATHFRGWAEGGNFCGTHNKYKVYFFMESASPLHQVSNANGVAVLSPTASVSVLRLKVGISYVNSRGAQLNLQTENPLWDFDQVKATAGLQWHSILGRIKVSGGTDSQKRVFYTALYHSFLHPNIFSDVNGAYRGFDKIDHFVQEVANHSTQYANFSGWDIYRTQIQLLAFMFPKRTGEILQSLVNDGLQCGAFPKWADNNDETGVMVGDPGTLIVANAAAFGVAGFDQNAALELMRKSGTVPGTKCNGHEVRPSLEKYLKYGYVPQDRAWFLDNNESASTSLEYASADFAASRFAQDQGRKDLSLKFFEQSTHWKNLFNSHTGYIEPRYSSGQWLWRYDSVSGKGFTEGNSAQYTWMIPFDVSGLMAQMGGPAMAASRLDVFFKELNAWDRSPYFWIGNEPDFSFPWLYHWAGAPEKSQKILDRIMTETFNDQAGGLPGNDDLGATSSWYVWAALGLYPAIPGTGGFAISRPLFPHVEIQLANNRLLILDTKGGNNSEVIQSIMVNGSPWKRSWLPLGDLKNATHIEFQTGLQPSTWAKDPSEIPPSFQSMP